ncbi:hypothetical protein H0H92_008074 [Tricholoma furcatifolium]|nr:hypothetical protein H0H92_008074 [Tricholoma furcatifolium]
MASEGSAVPAVAQGTVILSGANGTLGLGFVAAALKHYPTYHLILTVRNDNTSDKNTAKLYSLLSRFPTAQYTVCTLDLASLESVVTFSTSIAEKVSSGLLQPISAIVCNAFTWSLTTGMKRSVDGYEMTFQVNYLAHFGLVLRLLRSMDRTQGRVIGLSSDSHAPGGSAVEVFPPKFPDDIDLLANPLDDVPGEEDPAFEEVKSVTAVAVDPGTLPDSRATSQNAPVLWDFAMKYILNPFQPLLKYVMPQVRKSSTAGRELVELALGAAYAGNRAAGYYQGLRPVRSCEESYDEAKTARLWESSIRLWPAVMESWATWVDRDMSLSDAALIEKLENIAGVTNEPAIFDQERTRALLLLAKARRMLAEINTQPDIPSASDELAGLREHVAKLSIAIAPHKLVPTEILQHIFLSLLPMPERNTPSSINPLVLSKPPWSLGQSHENLAPESTDEPEICLNRLRCASDLLPTVAPVILYVHENSQPLTRALIPYMTRVTILQWTISVTYEGGSLDILPAASFSNLVHLKINLENGAEEGAASRRSTASYARLFGPSSRLEYLTLTLGSRTRKFLLLADIPWSRIVFFSLENGYDYWPVNARRTQALWKELGRLNPFYRNMTSLKSLTLQLNRELLPVITSFSFPWQRLVSLEIEWAGDLEDLQYALKQCRSVAKFSNSHNLRWLSIVLSPLDIDVYKLGEITRLFPRITYLACGVTTSIEPPGSATLDQSKVTFPKVQDLMFSVHYRGAPFSLPILVSPCIESVEVRATGDVPNLFDYIVLLVRANPKIKRVKYYCRPHDSHARPSAVRELLLALENCSSFYFKGINLSRLHLDELAVCALLPNLENLETSISAQDASRFVEAIVGRLEKEATVLGTRGVRLRKIVAHLSTQPPVERELARLRPSLREIENKYGVILKLEQLPSSIPASIMPLISMASEEVDEW